MAAKSGVWSIKCPLKKFRQYNKIREEKLTSFVNIVKEIDHSEAICISQEPRVKIGDVLLPWQEALEKYFAKSLP